jgi:hypothetical protein
MLLSKVFGPTPVLIQQQGMQCHHSTLIKDSIAAFNWEEIKPTVEINFPSYGHVLLSTEEFVDALSKLKKDKKPADKKSYHICVNVNSFTNTRWNEICWK